MTKSNQRNYNNENTLGKTYGFSISKDPSISEGSHVTTVPFWFSTILRTAKITV